MFVTFPRRTKTRASRRPAVTGDATRQHAHRDTLAFDWTRASSRSALLCLPAVALPLVLGAAAGHPKQVVMAAAGAFSVGFGAFQELRRSRTLPMLAGALGMCVSSWIGTIAGQSDVATIGVSALWAVLYGALSTVNTAAAWIALQCLIWLLISTAYPAAGLPALRRGSMVLAGGLLQILLVSVLRKSTGWALPLAGGPGAVARDRGLEDRSAVGRLSHGAKGPKAIQIVRTGVVLAVATTFYRLLAPPNGYWIPMTAALVVRPDLRQTFGRGVARIVGTLAGAAVATLIASTLRPVPSVLVALTLAFAAMAYLFLQVNYATFTACLTSYVVFVLALAGLPEKAVIAHRIINTLIGGATAFAVHAALAPVEQRLQSSHRSDAGVDATPGSPG